MAFQDYSGGQPQDVNAEQLDEDRSIITPRGVVEGHKGDWEVRYPDGNVARLTDEQWQELQKGGAPSEGKVVTKKEVEDNGSESDTSDDTNEKDVTEDTSGEVSPESEEKPGTPTKKPTRDLSV